MLTYISVRFSGINLRSISQEVFLRLIHNMHISQGQLFNKPCLQGVVHPLSVADRHVYQICIEGFDDPIIQHITIAAATYPRHMSFISLVNIHWDEILAIWVGCQPDFQTKILKRKHNFHSYFFSTISIDQAENAKVLQRMWDEYLRLRILCLRPVNDRRSYKVTPSLIGWAQT